MKNTIFFILSILILISCGKRVIEVENKNDSGVVIERYYLDKDSLKFGKYVSFSEDGNLFEESNYKKGKLNGERKIFFSNGNVEIHENYSAGQINGEYHTYYENGQVNLDAQYTDGKMEGIVKRFYSTGEILEEVTFVNNEENGPFKEYYKNGNVKWEGKYKDGDNEFGTINSYSEEGELIKKMECGKYGGEYICQTSWTKEEGDKELVLKYEE